MSQEGADFAGEPSQRKKIIQTVFISAIYFITGILRGQDGVVFLDLIYITHSDITSGSLIFTINALGNFTGVLIIGVLFDRFNNDILYCTSAVLAGLSTIIIPWCTPLTLMVVVYFVRSFFAGSIESGGALVCGRIWQLEAGSYQQLLQFVYAVGGIISPLITEPFLLKVRKDNLTSQAYEPQVFNLTGDHVGMSSYGKVGPTTYINDLNRTRTDDISSSFSETPNVEFATSRVYVAFAITGGLLLTICAAFTVKIVKYGSGEFDRFVKAKQGKKKLPLKRQNRLSFYSIPGRLIFYVSLAVNWFSQGCVEKILMSFLVAFTVGYLGWNKKNGSLAVTVFWAGYAGGRFVGIFLIKILESGTLLLATILGILATFCAMLLVDTVSWPDTCWWVLFGASGLSMSSLFGSKVSWIDSTLTPVSGKLMSFMFIWLYAGSMTHLSLLGYLFEKFSPLWFVYLLVINAIALFVSFLVLWLLSRKYRDVSQRGCSVIIQPPNDRLLALKDKESDQQKFEML